MDDLPVTVPQALHDDTSAAMGQPFAVSYLCGALVDRGLLFPRTNVARDRLISEAKAVKVIEPKWFLNEGLPLQSMAHPVRKGSGINLAELREILAPGLNSLFDDLYDERFDQWENVFASRGL